MDHMEFSISLPPFVDYTNAGVEWASMKQRLSTHNNYISDNHSHHDGLIKAFFISIAIEQVQEIFNMFGLSYDEVVKFSQILQRLEDVCVPRFLIIYNRFKFFTCQQAFNDKFDDFLRDLLNWSENCEFGDLRDILLKDCIITGIPDCSVRQRLLETEELDFSKTIEICRAVEKRQKARNAFVNTNQIIFVDAAVETESLNKSATEDKKIQEMGKEVRDVSTNTVSEDSFIDKSNLHVENYIQNDSTITFNRSLQSDDVCCTESVDFSDIVQDCETDNIEFCSIKEVSDEQTRSLRRSKRHKQTEEESLKNKHKIYNTRDQKIEKQTSKKSKVVQMESILRKSLINQDNKDSMKTFKVEKSNLQVENNADKIREKENKIILNPEASIKPQDKEVEENNKETKNVSLVHSCDDKMQKLDNHKEAKNSADNEFVCSFCGQNFPNRMSISSHMQKIHGRKNYRKVSLRCRVCRTMFKDIAALRKHRLVHRNEKKFQCEVCNAHFGNPSHLKVHMRKHTGERPYTCETCGASYPEASKLKTHMRKHTGEKPYHCSVCKRTFAWTAAYTRHMRIHTGEKPYTCEFCGVNFADFTSLQRHIRTHTHEKPYHCGKCNAKFSDPSALKLHNRIHNGERPYVCDTCKTSFTRSQHLREHMKLHTGEKPFSCETCDAKFLEASKLKSHSRKHTGEKPYLCKICGTRFAWTAAFTRHMRTHTMEKPYVCDFCDSRYADHSTLTRHRRTHTGERPYTCTVCGTNFADNSSLHRHTRIHTGEKLYTCDVCGSSFAVKSYLVRHLRTHTGEKPYSCDLCGSKFTDSSKLNRHKKIHSKSQGKQQKQHRFQDQQPCEQLHPVINNMQPQLFRQLQPVIDNTQPQQYEQLQPVGDNTQPQQYEQLQPVHDNAQPMHYKQLQPVLDNAQPQHYEQLQPVQRIPLNGEVQLPLNEKFDSWTDNQQQLISVIHNFGHPTLMSTALLQITDAHRSLNS